MKAVTYQGPNQVQVKQVDDAKLEKKDDIIVRITSTAICGSDLHLYQGNMPLPQGYIIGHEPMGIVEEVGPDVTKVKKAIVLLSPSTFLVDIVSIANTKWKVNVITQTLITILVVTLVIQRNLVIIQADKQNI